MDEERKVMIVVGAVFAVICLGLWYLVFDNFRPNPYHLPLGTRVFIALLFIALTAFIFFCEFAAKKLNDFHNLGISVASGLVFAIILATIGYGDGSRVTGVMEFFGWWLVCSMTAGSVVYAAINVWLLRSEHFVRPDQAKAKASAGASSRAKTEEKTEQKQQQSRSEQQERKARSDDDRRFDYDESTFRRSSAGSKPDPKAPRGYETRHPDDAALWAKIDDENCPEGEQLNALRAINRRKAKRQAKQGADFMGQSA